MSLFKPTKDWGPSKNSTKESSDRMNNVEKSTILADPILSTQLWRLRSKKFFLTINT